MYNPLCMTVSSKKAKLSPFNTTNIPYSPA